MCILTIYMLDAFWRLFQGKSLSINSTLSPSTQAQPAKHHLQQLEPNSVQSNTNQIRQIDKYLQSHLTYPIHPSIPSSSSHPVRHVLASYVSASPPTVETLYSPFSAPAIPSFQVSARRDPFCRCGEPIKRRILILEVHLEVLAMKVILVLYFVTRYQFFQLIWDFVICLIRY